MWLLLLTSLAFANVLSHTVNLQTADNVTWNYSFGVDYANDQFLLDGKPFRYVSGSFHYFRTPRQYWRDRLRKMRAAGLNAVCTYVEWSLHQPEPDQWHWSGDADIIEFINIAQQEDLLVLLRPGPYICAERDFGGLPYWLLKLVPDIKLRTKDPRYMRYAEIYLNEILTKVRPYLRGNGGPIIMVQVENEYGSYKACDTQYMNQLRSVFHQNIGDKALLYTTDGAYDNMLRCGFVPGAYTTVDFGTSVNITRSFELMRYYQPRGPLVNSEFYPGWLTHWNERFQRVKTNAVKTALDTMLSMNASVNIYMFYGGTNFGYTSGANGGEGSYSPQITSYDYDAPLTEAGDPTDKYFVIRNVIGKYLPLPNISLPSPTPKGDYGPILMDAVVELFNPQARAMFGSNHTRAQYPMTFEALGFSHWLVLYETEIPRLHADPLILNAEVRDRAQVYVDNVLSGTLSRIDKVHSMPLPNPYATNLKMLVENQGRLNYGNEFTDYKGISSVDVSGTPLRSWNMTGFRIQNIVALNQLTSTVSLTGILHQSPVFLRGNFTIFDEPRDTYLDTTGWGKGIAFVNGHNLGRYWPLAGPQITLYVPGVYLRTGNNELVLLELEYIPNTKKVKLQDRPILDGRLNLSKRYAREEPDGVS